MKNNKNINTENNIENNIENNTENNTTYKAIFENKIGWNTKNLILDYGENYDKILDIIEIIKNLNLEIHILNVKEELILELEENLKKHNYEKIYFHRENIFDFSLDVKFNNILFFDLFSLFSENDVNDILYKSKIFLKNDYSTFIFGNNVVTKYFNYMYHPISYINYIFKNNIYIEDMFDKLRQNGLYIVDSDRLHTKEILLYPFEYFSIICRRK